MQKIIAEKCFFEKAYGITQQIRGNLYIKLDQVFLLPKIDETSALKILELFEFFICFYCDYLKTIIDYLEEVYKQN